ncbi:MAG TPA: DUF1330 domain-containing protein [Sphingomonadaceae bacterium]|nr:DUF1330 domain-containing protein [Sphingomonadaceae bacterium]
MEQGTLIVIEAIAVHDGEGMARYVAGIAEQMAARGARTLAKGFDVLEGEPQGISRTVLHWPSVEAYRAWQESDEYRAFHALRLKSAQLNIIAVPLLAG